MDSESIEKLKFREENIFDDNDDHDDHDGHDDEHEGHDDHDDHDGHKDDDHNDHDDHDGHDDEHDDHAGHHDGHNHGEFDVHIWLDPENAKEMVKIIRDELIKIDPEGQRQYSVNAAGATLELDNLINNVEKELSKDVSYIVFHDAYQYFETRFGVKSAGALTLNPDVLPGAKQIADVQDLISDKGIKCIFSEPQYNPKIIETIGNDMNISTGVMDPLGAFIDAGPTMYVELINGIANSIKECH
jgi:zinc transport system substrate-binding protein